MQASMNHIHDELRRNDRRERILQQRRAKQYKLQQKRKRWDERIRAFEALRTDPKADNPSALSKKIEDAKKVFEKEKAELKDFLTELRRAGKLTEVNYTPSLDELRERLKVRKETGKIMPRMSFAEKHGFPMLDAETGETIKPRVRSLGDWYDEMMLPLRCR